MRIVTHAPFQPLVAERGLAFVPLDGNPNELFLRPELRSALTYDGNPLRSAGASRSQQASATCSAVVFLPASQATSSRLR